MTCAAAAAVYNAVGTTGLGADPTIESQGITHVVSVSIDSTQVVFLLSP